MHHCLWVITKDNFGLARRAELRSRGTLGRIWSLGHATQNSLLGTTVVAVFGHCEIVRLSEPSTRCPEF